MILNKSFLVLACISVSMAAVAQKASDIIENGIVVRSKEKIFLEWKNNSIRYDIGDKASNFTGLGDSAFFLPYRDAVNIYIKPLNPLNYSTKTAITFTEDQIDQNAANAFASITKLLSSLPAQSPTGTGQNTGNQPNPNPFDKKQNLIGSKPVPAAVVDSSCYKKVRSDIDGITALLADDQKPSLTDIFQALKALPFDDETQTIADIKTSQDKIDKVKAHFDSISTGINALKRDIDNYNTCKPPVGDSYVNLYIFNQILKDLKTSYTAQAQRLTNVTNAIGLVRTAQRDASKDKDGIKWYVDLGPIDVQKGKISNFTLTLSSDGFSLSDEKEVTKSDKKTIATKVIRLRKFQHFIPEVSAGIAYTWLTYPKYGTATDSAGKQHVASAGNDIVKQVNFTAMINYVYYAPNTPVHPYIQLGVGANASYPTIFLGMGLRFNQGLNRISIGGGFAGTWIQTLKTLKVGDIVTGTADIDKDKAYQFSFPLKPYVGIQYNF